ACHDAGSCDPTTGGCNDLPKANGTPCDDGLVCTIDDACAAGAYGGNPQSCDDGVACTADACSEELSGCVADSSGCTCATDEDCDDGNACNGFETCGTSLACVAGTPIDCGANANACNTGACDPATGACMAVPKP